MRKFVVWSAVCRDTSKFSYDISREISVKNKVLLVELPCLGIPRTVRFIKKIEKGKNIEAELTYYDRRNEVGFKNCYEIKKNLSIIPANIHSTPEFPITHQVSQESLISFPEALALKAAEEGFLTVVFECQGQLTTPMTYKAITTSDLLLVPIYYPNDIYFSLSNILILEKSFNFKIYKSAIVCSAGLRNLISEIWMHRNQQNQLDLTIWNDNCVKIVNRLIAENHSQNMLKTQEARAWSKLSILIRRIFQQ